MKKKSATFLFLFLFLFLLLFYYGVAQYILDVKYATDDDLYFSSANYSDWVGFAQNQGRISHYLDGILSRIPYLFDNQFYYLAIQLGSLVVMSLSVILMIKATLKNSYISILYGILIFVLWQNSHGHNLMVSYPFYVTLSVVTFSLSIIFFTWFLDKKISKYLFFSIFFWILTLKGSEFWVVYLPLFLIIAYSRSLDTGFKEKTIYCIKKSRYHVYAVFINILIYFTFRWQVDNMYSGNIVNIQIENILYSWFSYTAGLFPGYQFYLNVNKFGVYTFLDLIDLKTVLLPLVVLSILILVRENSVVKKLDKKSYILIGVLMSFAPTFLVSLTEKYQSWVIHHNASDYLPSSFSYLSIVFIVAVMLATIKSKTHYIFISIFISILVFTTQLNNKYIGIQQSNWAERFFLLNAFFQTEYTEDGVLVSPTLWSNRIYSGKGRENSLSKYAKYNSGKNIEILKNGISNTTLKYFKSEKNKSSFLTYSESNKLKAIFLSSEKCNKIHPCYLLSAYPSLNGSVMHNTSVANGLVYKAQVISIPDQENIYGINTYHVKSDIDDRQMTMLLEYNSTLDMQQVVDFDEGFYTLEQDGVNKWIWAFGNGKINIKSPIDIEAQLMISLRTATKRTMKFKLNDKVYEVEFKDNKLRDIVFPVNLNKGNNALEILSNAQSIKLSKADDRMFSYAIFDIGIMDIDEVGKID